MRIKNFVTLAGNPTTGQKLAIDTEEGTRQIDYDALATAIINKLGGDPVTIAHGGTGATSASDARANLDVRCRIFNSVSQLGLTSGSATILQAFDAMGDNAILIASSDDFASSARPDGAAGIVEIIRKADSRSYVAFRGKTGTNSRDWRMFENATSYNGNRANAPDGVWHPDFAGLRGGTGSSGTTLAIDVPNSSSHLLICGGNSSTRQYVGLIFVNSSGAPTVTQILAGTAYTVTTSTNKVTVVSSSSGTELGFMCLPIRGNPFTGYTIT